MLNEVHEEVHEVGKFTGKMPVLSGTTFDLPDILSSGRFVLPQKMSSDKMCMSIALNVSVS